jgi:hypothetical protein
VTTGRYIIYIFIVDVLICLGLAVGSVTHYDAIMSRWHIAGVDGTRSGQYLTFFTFFILLK